MKPSLTHSQADWFLLILNIGLVFAEIMYLMRFQKLTNELSFGNIAYFIFFHSMMIFYRAICEGHDYFFFLCIYSLETMQGESQRVAKTALVLPYATSLLRTPLQLIRPRTLTSM